jgi:hypothetical protein
MAREEMRMERPQEVPTVLISPETRAALAAESERTGVTGEMILVGGLLFGYPVDAMQRLVVSYVRLSADVGFGRKDFSIDQTRTSRMLDEACKQDPKADYCGVWYIHRTPNRDIFDEEWEQALATLEDPDLPFDDLVCMVLCFYGGKLQIHASSFNRYHASRGQPPAPAELRLTTDWLETTPQSAAPTKPTEDWYKTSAVAARLNQEHQRLAEKYAIESALAPDGQMFFRLSNKRKYQKLSFYLAVGDGFPERAPHVFLLVGGKPHRVSIPSLGSWSETSSLVDTADELVEWLAFSKDEYLTEAEAALGRGSYAQAADLVKLVLAIDPRMPGAPRLLAKATAA